MTINQLLQLRPYQKRKGIQKVVSLSNHIITGSQISHIERELRREGIKPKEFIMPAQLLKTLSDSCLTVDIPNFNTLPPTSGIPCINSKEYEVWSDLEEDTFVVRAVKNDEPYYVLVTDVQSNKQ